MDFTKIWTQWSTYHLNKVVCGGSFAFSFHLSPVRIEYTCMAYTLIMEKSIFPAEIFRVSNMVPHTDAKTAAVYCFRWWTSESCWTGSRSRRACTPISWAPSVGTGSSVSETQKNSLEGHRDHLLALTLRFLATLTVHYSSPQPLPFLHHTKAVECGIIPRDY